MHAEGVPENGQEENLGRSGSGSVCSAREEYFLLTVLDQYWPPWRATSVKPTKLDTKAGSWITISVNPSFGSADGH